MKRLADLKHTRLPVEKKNSNPSSILSQHQFDKFAKKLPYLKQRISSSTRERFKNYFFFLRVLRRVLTKTVGPPTHRKIVRELGRYQDWGFVLANYVCMLSTNNSCRDAHTFMHMQTPRLSKRFFKTSFFNGFLSPVYWQILLFFIKIFSNVRYLHIQDYNGELRNYTKPMQ